MKQYLVFGYYGFYPRGGMNDFIDSFDTEEEAYTRIKADHKLNEDYDPEYEFNLEYEYECDYYQVHNSEIKETLTFKAIDETGELKPFDPKNDSYFD